MENKEKEMSPLHEPLERLDAVVVGAGPYGLSAAAHLRARGLRVAVFGKPLELWREHMPRGMLLRSQWWAANLSDPGRRYTLERFFQESGQRPVYPVPLDTFIEYGRWFQRLAVPDVDETLVASIDRRDGSFLIVLEDGRRFETAAVVMAIGLRHYARPPDEFRGMSPDRISHSSDVREPERFRGRRVVVVGGGQSAVEYAALLNEAGATVDLVSRRPIVWLERDRFGERGVLERMLAPDTGLGPGWRNWVLEHLPHVFYRLPRAWKDRALVFYSGAWAADWLAPRVVGKVNLHEGATIRSFENDEGTVNLTLSDGTRIRADHVVFATGYRVDIGRLPMIAPGLRAMIRTEQGVPVLRPSFESTVPGLYFVGATSIRHFGPIFRFVLGCRPAARRVARAVAHHGRASRAPGTASEGRRRAQEEFPPEPRKEPRSLYPADEGPDP